MSILIQEVKDNAYNLLMYKLNKDPNLKELNQEQIKSLIAIVYTVSTESVTLVKNKVNNL